MKKALLVGVGGYRDPALGPLPHAVDDVRALAAALGAFGFEAEVLENPSADGLVDAAGAAVSGLGPRDSLLFVFRGRGFVSRGGDQVLACADDDAGSLGRDAGGVSLPVLVSLCRNGAGFARAFVIDACRPEKGDGAGAVRKMNRCEPCGDCGGGFCALRPSDRLLPAFDFDDIGHGAFAQALLEALGENKGRDLSIDRDLALSLGSRLAGIVSEHGGFALVNPLFDGGAVRFQDVEEPEAGKPGDENPWTEDLPASRDENPWTEDPPASGDENPWAEDLPASGDENPWAEDLPTSGDDEAEKARKMAREEEERDKAFEAIRREAEKDAVATGVRPTGGAGQGRAAVGDGDRFCVFLHDVPENARADVFRVLREYGLGQEAERLVRVGGVVRRGLTRVGAESMALAIRNRRGVAVVQRQGGAGGGNAKDVALYAWRTAMLGVLVARARRLGEMPFGTRRTADARGRVPPALTTRRTANARERVPPVLTTGDYMHVSYPEGENATLPGGERRRGWSTSTTAMLLWGINIVLFFVLAAHREDYEITGTFAFYVWVIGLICEICRWGKPIGPKEQPPSGGATFMLIIGMMAFLILIAWLLD